MSQFFWTTNFQRNGLNFSNQFFRRRSSKEMPQISDEFCGVPRKWPHFSNQFFRRRSSNEMASIFLGDKIFLELQGNGLKFPIDSNHFQPLLFTILTLILVENGLAALLEPLTKDLNIQYRQIVQSIVYDKKTEQVHVSYAKNPACVHVDEDSEADSSPEPDDTESMLYKANAVLCTVPVGCLKESETKELKVDEEDRLSVPAIKFDPPLPTKKREAIEAIGIGSINKIILIFERRFWSENNFFGRINDKESARGELFLFVSNPGSSVLSVYMSGAAANLGDTFSSDDLANKLMQVLNKIYGTDCPAAPKDVILTSWHTNELANGCFPYIPVGRSDEDYDTLAEPVEFDSGIGNKRHRLFFAGDHTCRDYPGRLHGAFLSGLREAARIANTFLGPINGKGKQAEYEQIGQSYTKNMRKPVEEVYLSD